MSKGYAIEVRRTKHDLTTKFIKCIYYTSSYRQLLSIQLLKHTDLKPENILLTFDKERGKCVDLKLCDFGLSTKFNSTSILTDFCGSPGEKS